MYSLLIICSENTMNCSNSMTISGNLAGGEHIKSVYVCLQTLFCLFFCHPWDKKSQTACMSLTLWPWHQPWDQRSYLCSQQVFYKHILLQLNFNPSRVVPSHIRSASLPMASILIQQSSRRKSSKSVNSDIAALAPPFVSPSKESILTCSLEEHAVPVTMGKWECWHTEMYL